MKELDNIDRQLISLLRSDARLSVSMLAKKIQVSRATIQNRMNRLEKNGTITGYTALGDSK
ncbi:MAG: AsnC family transcriptional regulator [Alteromonadaceae bacterium]|nr:AsnC family transcriptional regulator [Alteromonadaceae bacterium]